MKINRHYFLDWFGKPVRYDYSSEEGAIKKEYDRVTIIHYPHNKYFRPIVLDKHEVVSTGTWNILSFYEGVLGCLATLKDKKPRCDGDEYYDIDYGIAVYDLCGRWKARFVRWGCREFTKKQLLLIKEMMEWHYGKSYFKGINEKKVAKRLNSDRID